MSLSHVVARAVVCIICICGDYLLWDISWTWDLGDVMEVSGAGEQ